MPRHTGGPIESAGLRRLTGAASLRNLAAAVALRALALAAIAALAVALLSAAAAPALANTEDIVEKQNSPPTAADGWQAGTCKEDTPICSVETEGQYFEQAGGHPQVGFTQIIVKHDQTTKKPVGELKTVRVDLPVGLSVNPQATPQCPLKKFEESAANCEPLGAKVGESEVTAWLPVLGLVPPVAGVTQVPVYNIVPEQGEPARFGFELAGNEIFLRADVAWESDYHEGFRIEVPATPLKELESVPGFEAGGLIYKNRLVFNGRSGNGTFVTTPTTCLGPSNVAHFEHVYSTLLRADGYGPGKEDPNFPNGSSYLESPIPATPPLTTPTFPKECESIPFEPSLEVEPNTAQTDSPSGAAVEVKLPFEEPDYGKPPKSKEAKEQASSQLRDATVTMPLGMGLDPSAANGLVACSDAQFGKGTSNPENECPSASKIGTVEVQTPPLKDPLEGSVYLGQQLSRDPTSGNEYRILVEVQSARYGISARLVGHVAADPKTGQLTATFAENPQVPFTSFLLHFNKGSRAPLTSPPTCGPHKTTSQMTPWSSAVGSIPPGSEPGSPSMAPPAIPSREFTLTSAPGGGACPKTLSARPFAPGFGAKNANPQAGAFSELRLTMTRVDGEQELKGAAVSLPPGVTAKLAGVSYCPEAAIAAAEANSGSAEAASPSCPASSLVGTVTVLAGSGEPLQIGGKAFLAGPYHGAPLSLAIVTPATAGPFDLGSVVVRVALFVDPETAQVKAVSDPIPHVFGGALLDIRSITVDMNRPRFSLNPTNCSPKQFNGTIQGGGANPADPAAFSSASVSAPFQASGCNKLGFAPRLFLRLRGNMRRSGHPALRAVFAARAGDANPARVAVTLPHFLFLDQANIAKVCTRVQFAEGSTPGERCPADSVYGYARAVTPLLDKPLEGPVYLRSSSNLLPDLVASLHGQVNVVLDGRTDSVNGRIRNTFEAIPDVPVSRFLLTMPGGGHGLLVNSESICPRHGRGPSLATRANMTGQNGKTENQHLKLGVPCRPRRHHRKHHHHHNSHRHHR